MKDETRRKLEELFLNALRIVVALLFMQHGVQKLFAGFGARAVAEFGTLRWWAGVLEFYGGGLLALGLLTRPVAFVLAGEMAVAYFRSHFPRGWVPIMNGGELAAFYCWTFLYLSVRGGGGFSVDGWLRRRRAARAAPPPGPAPHEAEPGPTEVADRGASVPVSGEPPGS